MSVPEITGRLHAVGRVAILVSRYNELITTRLLDGARACCRDAGLDESQVDVVWTPGAFELPAVAAAAAERGRYAALIALGAVVRGDTPHFDYVAGEASRGLADASAEYEIPIGFGLLTTDTMEQAEARAGGAHGNKGWDAAVAALEMADLFERLDGTDEA